MPRCPSQEGNGIDGPTVRLSLGRGDGRCIATVPIETHPHHSLNWENGAPGPREGPGGVRLTAGTTYSLNMFG